MTAFARNILFEGGVGWGFFLTFVLCVCVCLISLPKQRKNKREVFKNNTEMITHSRLGYSPGQWAGAIPTNEQSTTAGRSLVVYITSVIYSVKL